MGCKNKKEPTLPPPLICTYGNTFEDDTVAPPGIQNNKTTEDDKPVVPSTVYVQVMVVIDNMLFTKLGEQKEKVELYTRQFMSAVNIKFQGQFKNPRIKFVIREVLKFKTSTSYMFTKTTGSYTICTLANWYLIAP